MLKPFGQIFYELGRALENFRAALGQETVLDRTLPKDATIHLISTLDALAHWSEEVGLNPLSVYTRTCLDNVARKATFKSAREIIEGLQKQVYKDLGGVSFKFIPPPNSVLYSLPSAFGQQVATKFPSAGYDIEEAAKCFALERYTACVMHLMRVAEAGLKAYGTSLNVMAQITAAQANWGRVLKIADDEIIRLNASGDPTWTSEKKEFFAGTHALLNAVRVAWRNPSMHAEQRYDQKRARLIFDTVKGWMDYMAEHLEESGKFTP